MTALRIKVLYTEALYIETMRIEALYIITLHTALTMVLKESSIYVYTRFLLT
jgi:hypothetical protein